MKIKTFVFVCTIYFKRERHFPWVAKKRDIPSIVGCFRPSLPIVSKIVLLFPIKNNLKEIFKNKNKILLFMLSVFSLISFTNIIRDHQRDNYHTLKKLMSSIITIRLYGLINFAHGNNKKISNHDKYSIISLCLVYSPYLSIRMIVIIIHVSSSMSCLELQIKELSVWRHIYLINGKKKPMSCCFSILTTCLILMSNMFDAILYECIDSLTIIVFHKG